MEALSESSQSFEVAATRTSALVNCQYRVEHSKIKFVSTSGHVISFISPMTAPCEHSLRSSSS